MMCIRDNSLREAAKKVKVNCEGSREKALRKRIKAMEVRVAKLEAQIAEIRLSTGPYYDDSDPDDQPPFAKGPISIEPERKRAGAPSRFTTWEFKNRRDGMVFIIENFWPEFVAMFAEENPTPEKLQQCLRNQFPGREAEENFRRILDHPKEFWEAVYGKEIPRIPRRIAYALAGVGKMTLRSSMARCDREPCELRIQLRAMDEHIRREHLAWHRKLADKGVCPATLKEIPEKCKDCQRFQRKPERLAEALAVKPFRWGAAHQSAHTVEPLPPEAV